MKAIYKNQILADASETLVVEGRHYFPQDSVELKYLFPSDYCVECPWKGLANYYNLEVSGDELPNAAWYYPNPKDEAVHITGYISFSDNIQVVD
jgi:uncharacterized protein (DUF427 family)